MPGIQTKEDLYRWIREGGHSVTYGMVKEFGPMALKVFAATTGALMPGRILKKLPLKKLPKGN